MKEKKFRKGIIKRLLSVVLAVAMVISPLPMNNGTVAYAADAGDLFVYIPAFNTAGKSTSEVSKVNITKGIVEKKIEVGNTSLSIVEDAKGFVYVSNGNSPSISVIDPATDTVTKTITISGATYFKGITIDPAMENLYIATSSGAGINAVGTLYAYNIKTGNTKSVLSCYNSFYYCSVTEDFIYVVYTPTRDYGKRVCARYSFEKNSVDKTVDIPSQAMYGSLSPDGSKYAIITGRGYPNEYESTIIIVDAETMTIDKVITLSKGDAYYNAGQFADYSKDGKYIYVLSQIRTVGDNVVDSGRFCIFDANTYELKSTMNFDADMVSAGVGKDANTLLLLPNPYSGNKDVRIVDVSNATNPKAIGKISLTTPCYAIGSFTPSSYVQNKIKEAQHQHNFVFSLSEDGKTIEAYCNSAEGGDNCPYYAESYNAAKEGGKLATLTLAPESPTYNTTGYAGVSQTEIDSFKSTTGLAANPTIKYYKVETEGDTTGGVETTVDDIIKSVGNYYVEVTISGSAENGLPVSAVAPFKVVKATPVAGNFTYTAPTPLTYDGTAKSATVEAKSGIEGMGAVTVKYYDSNDNEVTSPKDAGNYTVKVSVAEGTNYNAITTPITVGTFAITKAITYDGTDTASGNLRAKTGKTVEITLPTLPSGASYGTAVNSYTSFFTVGAVSNGKVTITSVKDWNETTENTAKTFTIPVTGATNYNDYVVTVTITPTFHTHDFAFAVTGNTIVATCSEDDCDLEEEQASLTFTASNPTYGDSEIEPTITYGSPAEQTVWTNEAELVIPETEPTDPKAPVVTKKYFKADASGNNKVGSALESAPTDAGKYIVEVTISYGNNPDKTVTVPLSYAIKKKADVSATPKGGQGKITIEGMDPDQEYIVTTEPDPTKLTDDDWENPVGPDGVVTGLIDRTGPYYVYTRTKEDDNHPAGAVEQMGPCYTNVERPENNWTGYEITDNTITVTEDDIEIFSDQDCKNFIADKDHSPAELLPDTIYYVRRKASGDNPASEPFAFSSNKSQFVAPTGLDTVPDTGSKNGTPNGKVLGVTTGMEYSFGEDIDGDGEIDWISVDSGTEITGLPNGKILVRFKGTDDPNVYTTLWIGAAPSNGNRGGGSCANGHRYEWGSWGQVSKDEDGTQVYQCVICGDVLEKELIPAYAYTCLTESERVLKTPQNGSVICDMGRWNAYPRWFFEKLATRPDVNITLKFLYQHKQYTVSIPAGTKIDTECDWYGPLKICSLYKFEVK